MLRRLPRYTLLLFSMQHSIIFSKNYTDIKAKVVEKIVVEPINYLFLERMIRLKFFSAPPKGKLIPKSVQERML